MFTRILFFIIVSGLSLPAFAKDLSIEPYSFKTSDGHEVVAEKGYFEVPVNRANGSDETMQLGFIRFSSTSPKPGAPIVYLAGGPGGSGSGTAAGPRFPLFMKLRQVADVIAFDQRGTGLSNHLPACPNPKPLPLDIAGTRAAYLTHTRREIERCAAFWRKEGIDLAAYNTRESADDLDDLRKALGTEKISLWGISYGTHLALAALKRHPDRIERVVLASAEGLDQTVKLPARTDEFLMRLSRMIARDPVAGEIYPDLFGMMKRVLARVERETPTVTFTDPREERQVTVKIGPYDLQLATGYLIKNPDTLPRLAAAYAQLDAKDYSAAAPFVAQLRSALQLNPMSLAMDDASGISPERLALIERQRKSALLSDALNFPFPALFGTLGVRDLGSEFRRPVKTNVPALFLSGTLDGRTYIDAHREIMRGFSHATHVVIENAGHDLFMSTPGVHDVILKFLKAKRIRQRHLKAPPVDWKPPE